MNHLRDGLSAIIKTLLIVLFAALIGGCSNDFRKASDQLEGKWIRSDGTYRIEIKKVKEEGKLIAAYYNPDSIHVGRAGWRL